MPEFDRRCSGIFFHQFRHWLPTGEMLKYRSEFDRRTMSAIRRIFGWIPIMVWRGRSLCRRTTLGIFRRRSTYQFRSDWSRLAELALRPQALAGDIMQAILLSSKYRNAALRVEQPRDGRFIYHIKYKVAWRYGIYLQREVDLPNRIAIHKYIYGSQQKLGFATEMMRRSIEFYEALGIHMLRLKAGLNLGGALWAKYGFRPIDPDQWELCKTTIVTNRERLSAWEINGDVLRQERDKIDYVLRSTDPAQIWVISSMQSRVYDGTEDPRKLGDALLRGSQWEGLLDLNDRAAKYILDRRIRPHNV